MSIFKEFTAGFEDAAEGKPGLHEPLQVKDSADARAAYAYGRRAWSFVDRAVMRAVVQHVHWHSSPVLSRKRRRTGTGVYPD